VEVGGTGKGGSDQTAKQAALGSILTIFSKTIKSMDDFEVLNNLN